MSEFPAQGIKIVVSERGFVVHAKRIAHGAATLIDQHGRVWNMDSFVGWCEPRKGTKLKMKRRVRR